MRIVVVEDGAKIRRGIIRLIQKINPGYQVIGEAANGVDGIRIIIETKPDLVIADIRMPELNGLEMLKDLKEQGIKHKTVILSAYSDFAFAQQAITIGVSEYLLKPVTAQKLQRTLVAIEEELAEEIQQSQSSRLLTIKHVLQDLIMGKAGKNKELKLQLKNESGFGGEHPFALVGAFTGNKIYDQEALQQVLNQILSGIPEFNFFVLDIELSGLTIALIACPSDFSKMEAFLEKNLLAAVDQHDFPNLVMGWVTVDSAEELHTKLQKLREIFKWALLLSKGEMITESKVAQMKPQPLIFPDELEKQVIAAVIRKNFQNLREICNEFILWWQKSVYSPDQIITGFIRFISSITNAVKETDMELFKQLKHKEILQRVLDTVTMDQLEATMEEILHHLTKTEQIQNPNYSLTIVKALKLIRDHFQQGINREEIAQKLHITPEYLSMLFYKEVGQSFTAYLKNYRINKAKELLINGDIKIYEVAEQVGYPDSKYFCRVFKEVTGVPPGEYQKYLLQNI